MVDLYAEAARNPKIAELVLDVVDTAMSGVTDLIARSPEGQASSGLRPNELSELIFAVARGMLMRDVLQPVRDDRGRTPRTTACGRAKTLGSALPDGGTNNLCMT